MQVNCEPRNQNSTNEEPIKVEISGVILREIKQWPVTIKYIELASLIVKSSEETKEFFICNPEVLLNNFSITANEKKALIKMARQIRAATSGDVEVACSAGGGAMSNYSDTTATAVGNAVKKHVEVACSGGGGAMSNYSDTGGHALRNSLAVD